MSVRKDWVVSCEDATGRRREMIVFADEAGVVVVAPPGETALLSALEVGRLRSALLDAVTEAARCAPGGDRGSDRRDPDHHGDDA